jgi:type II secretory pathway component PulC
VTPLPVFSAVDMVGAMRTLLLTAMLLVVATAAQAADPPPAAVVEGTLTRAEVQQVLDRGPQRFIAALRVAPVLDKGKFLGFKLVSIQPESPLAAGTSVALGDVVLAVNDQPLERPEQFMRAWDMVKGADSLSVLLLRDGRRLQYRWKIAP